MIRAPERIWWLHPALVFTAIGAGVAGLAYVMPESAYYDLWRTPKFFHSEALQLSGLCIGVFLFGWFLGNQRLSGTESDNVQWTETIPWPAMLRLFSLSFYLCMAGYLVWAATALARGASLNALAAVMTGKMPVTMFRLNYLSGNIAGLTSLTQFGLGVVVLGSVAGFGVGWGRVRAKCVIVFVLAALRAYLNTERLAFIELVVPFIVLCAHLTWSRRETGARARALIRFGPAIGAVSLFGLFTLFEYFRSWLNFYATRSSSLFAFSGLRLLGYYVTAANNGAYVLERLGHPIGGPYFTLNFLWTFPFVDEVIKSFLPTPGFVSTDQLLAHGANVEFNSVDGYLTPFMDYPWPGALLYWLALGIICSILYRAFQAKSPLGLFLYPAAYLGLLEMPRYIYWAQGRAFVSLCILIVAAEICRHSRAKIVLQESAAAPPPVHGFHHA